MSAVERHDAIEHIATCGHCREQVGALVALMRTPQITTEVVQLNSAPLTAAVSAPARANRQSRRRTLWTATTVLAAAASAWLFVRPSSTPPVTREHGDATITANAAPVPLFPLGDVTNANTLRWSAVSGTDRYRVTLYDALANVLFETQLTDTSVAIPGSVHLERGRSYLWKVEDRTGWDRWASSELMEFRVDSAGNTSPPLPQFSNSPAVEASERDSLRIRARLLSDSALASAIRADPHEVRDALASSLSLAVHGPETNRGDELSTAKRIAAAYSSAWHDDYLARQVATFSSWPANRRATKLLGDSIRRAGVTAFARDGTAPAIALWKIAAARAKVVGDTAGVASSYGNIGAALVDEGNADSARVYLGLSRSLAHTIGDIRVEANATASLAALSERGDDIGGARERYAQSIALRGRIGDTRGLASDYNSLAGIARTMGDFSQAQRQLELALALNRRNHQPEFAATNLVNLATLASLTGEFSRADTNYREALATWRAKKQWANVADALRGVGDLE
ncbi:MAG: tetratricopeptide repeat protein, partial [Gemmatimonadota bacterium]|nr:tetratricopeptide repeat protein [Gemmatimonadota bacterium]